MTLWDRIMGSIQPGLSASSLGRVSAVLMSGAFAHLSADPPKGLVDVPIVVT
ncbi:MAG TPA: hypothetical protein PK777_08400 [Thermoguttaceae bacterium]|nr:hypothetical protein [Thermoguttaceae bacterium]HPP52954.1 hypothetical protein [Thermoguttaceae bacterium]